MQLTSEDNLRINVLLANANAVRIDENRLCVYGLSEQGEARVQLNPNCHADRYVRYVRELLSTSVLGSPGGYPVYLKRWTRMGQINNSRLDDLLMLGEPEAVVAVARSPALTDDLASRAWWAMPDADNARRMLQRQCVVEGHMGRVLADFLVEFLPFEVEPWTIIETVRLLLQPGLITDEERAAIWSKGQSKNVFRIGFLIATPDDLPERHDVHPELAVLQTTLDPLADAGNPYARVLSRCLSASGQAFLHTAAEVLRKPSNQDVVVALLEAVVRYFEPVRLNPAQQGDLAAIVAGMNALCAPDGSSSRPAALSELIAALPNHLPMIRAMLILGHSGEPVVRELFGQSDSIGSLMRRKLEPISRPLLTEYAKLLGRDRPR